MAAGTDIPLEAVLKLAVDRDGSQAVGGFLEKYTSDLKTGEDSVRRTNDMFKELVGHAGQLSDHLKGLGGLVGLAGAGAVAQQYMAVSGAGAGAAMAEGHLTGSDGIYGAYARSLLSVQSSTGVPYTQVEEGLRTAAQMIGGNLSPQGAARFGALLAGAGLAGGLTTQAIGSVVGSLMESSGQTMGAANGEQGTANATSLMAGVTQALSSFQGTQVSTMLPAVASLYEQQSLRSGPRGPHEGPAQTASFVNALAEANPLFRSQKTVEAAIEGGNSYLLSGLTNPQVMFAERRAGISTNEAIEGGPGALEKLSEGLYDQFGNSQLTRDYLRSTFPTATAKMLEEAHGHPGLLREAHRKALEAAIDPNVRGYENDIHHSLAAQTPEAELSKFGAGLLSDVMGVVGPVNNAIGPVPTAASILIGGGVAGALAKGVAKTGLGVAGNAVKGTGGTLLDALGLGDATGLEAGALSLGDIAGGAMTGGVGTLGMMLLNPESTGGTPQEMKASAEAMRNQAVEAAMTAAKHQHGGDWLNHQKQMEEYVQHHTMTLGRGNEEYHHDSDSASEGQHILREALGVARVPQVVKDLEKKFGSEWYMPSSGHKQKEIEGAVGKELGSKSAGRQTLDEEIGQLRKYQELGPESYWQIKFGESVGKFTEAVEKFMKGNASGHKNTAYEGGASMHDAAYSPLSTALATAPGAVYASWLKGTPGKPASPGEPTAQDASFYTLEGHTNVWNQALEAYSGDGYGQHGKSALGYILQLAKEHTGGGAHRGDRRTVEADARKYGIPFDVLWGVYGAESSFGKAASNFGLTGQFPGTGTSGNFGTDARMASEDIRKLLRSIDRSLKRTKGKWS